MKEMKTEDICPKCNSESFGYGSCLDCGFEGNSEPIKKSSSIIARPKEKKTTWYNLMMLSGVGLLISYVVSFFQGFMIDTTDFESWANQTLICTVMIAILWIVFLTSLLLVMRDLHE